DADFNPPQCAGFHIDPETGDVSFRATQTDQTVFAFAVDEYRKDPSTGKYVKVATIRRDLQIIIIDCPANQSPIVYGINGTSQTTADFCANQNKCFTINTFDPDPDDTVFISWNNPRNMPGATFNTDENGKKKWPKGTFCWSPTNDNVRTYPYRF